MYCMVAPSNPIKLREYVPVQEHGQNNENEEPKNLMNEEKTIVNQLTVKFLQVVKQSKIIVTKSSVNNQIWNFIV